MIWPLRAHKRQVYLRFSAVYLQINKNIEMLQFSLHFTDELSNEMKIADSYRIDNQYQLLLCSLVSF